MKERPQSIKPKYLIEPRFADDGTQISSGILSNGQEEPDPVPMSPPVGYEPPTQLEQLIEQILRRRDFNLAAAAAGAETFEEADDFEVEDEDYDPRFPETIYEAYFDAKSKRRAAVESARKSVGTAASSEVDGDRKSQVTVTDNSPRGGENEATQSVEKPAGALKEDAR